MTFLAIKKAKEAQKTGKIVAILWHKGESDAMKNTENYTGKLRTVIRIFKKDLLLADDVPFIAGDAEDPSFRIVTTKDLMHRGDNLHYDTASRHELGKRYFDAYQKFHSETE